MQRGTGPQQEPGLVVRQWEAGLPKAGEPHLPPMPCGVKNGRVPTTGYLNCSSAYLVAENTEWLCQKVPNRKPLRGFLLGQRLLRLEARYLMKDSCSCHPQPGCLHGPMCLSLPRALPPTPAPPAGGWWAPSLCCGTLKELPSFSPAAGRAPHSDGWPTRSVVWKLLWHSEHTSCKRECFFRMAWAGGGYATLQNPKGSWLAMQTTQ